MLTIYAEARHKEPGFPITNNSGHEDHQQWYGAPAAHNDTGNLRLTDRQAKFPNLRRLFIEARSDDEEREVSRKAVSEGAEPPSHQT